MAGQLLWQELFDGDGLLVWQELLEQNPVNPDPPDPPTLDAITPQVAPRTISGTAVPGATVQIVITLVPYTTVIADVNGDWAFAFNEPPGAYSIEVRQIVDSVASEYTPAVVFHILPDEDPPEHHGGSGRDDLRDIPEPPITAAPGGGLLKRPFRRPPVWPTEKGY